MRRCTVVAAALLAAALGPTPLSAQIHREVILGQLDAAAEMKKSDGYRPDPSTIARDAVIGLLAGGGAVILEVNLVEGGSYFISGGCDADCDDLDLRPSQEEGDTVAEDVETDDVPILDFVAPRSGRYLLIGDDARLLGGALLLRLPDPAEVIGP